MNVRKLPPGAFLARGLAFALLWWVLAEGRANSWALGVAATLAATLASLRLLPPGGRRIGVLPLPSFLLFFLWSSLRGGMQVAVMALRRRPGLRPAIVEISLALPPGAPRLLFLNALTLMPGALGVRLDDNGNLRVHVLDARLSLAAEAGALEARIARLFGVARGGAS